MSLILMKVDGPLSGFCETCRAGQRRRSKDVDNIRLKATEAVGRERARAILDKAGRLSGLKHTKP